MQIDIITYLTGISNTIYVIVCLLCGLQLCFGIFSQYRHANTLLSKIMGSCLLVLSCSGVCYLLSNMLPHLSFLYRIGVLVDISIFIGYAIVGYVLYTNSEPSITKLIILASPFAICALLNIFFPNWLSVLFCVAAAILFVNYIYFGVALQRRERQLGDLYSDPESHSLQWIWTIIGLFVGWWLVFGLFSFLPTLEPWCNTATFVYMSVLLLFFFAKVSNYKQPVSLATQEAMGNATNENTENNEYTIDRLKKLMQEEMLYLNPDLTIENVATRLSTTPHYLSAILNKDMHTSFSQFVNGYRVERAKELLSTTNDKVEYIGSVCGFNSVQVFNRTFSKFIGHTPTDYRKR